MTNPSEYRPELPPIPARMLSLPIRRGYPVPWFVDVNPETNDYDFRMADDRKKRRAVMERRCWLCGEPLGRYGAFVLGPMCAVNRVSSEPPCHLECADFAARACPFLVNPHEKRRQTQLPEEMLPAPGVGLERNPGVALVWVTRSYSPFLTPKPTLELKGATVGAGLLFRIGPCDEARWYCEGRPATHAEVKYSIDTGLPLLTQGMDPEDVKHAEEFQEQLAAAMALLPLEVPA